MDYDDDRLDTAFSFFSFFFLGKEMRVLEFIRYLIFNNVGWC